MKKLLSIVLSLAMLFSMTTVAVAKETNDENLRNDSIKEEIINDHYDKLAKLNFQSTENRTLEKTASNVKNVKLGDCSFEYLYLNFSNSKLTSGKFFSGEMRMGYAYDDHQRLASCRGARKG